MEMFVDVEGISRLLEGNFLLQIYLYNFYLKGNLNGKACHYEVKDNDFILKHQILINKVKYMAAGSR